MKLKTFTLIAIGFAAGVWYTKANIQVSVTSNA